MEALDREIDEYVEEYNKAIDDDLKARKALREKKQAHQRKIAEYNTLLLAQGVTLFILIIALILNAR